MQFVKINEIRRLLAPHHGKSVFEKIKILWSDGWKANPAVVITVAFMPIMVVHGLYEYYFHDTRYHVKKYQKEIIIYRPGDPRIAEIQHYSILDK
ncbi:hypothetical protein KPH14_003314 [Odynerus spinipes]|uniref:Uncharacterized protein n=1 Tax=Odynerus spinipes TaxID=1348599 RepID=A0AAD9VJL7_9HYME|nr:hypothetical protein KPH14_003314 [Odynerus spinipes]